MMRKRWAALAAVGLAACGPGGGGDTYETFTEKCLPLAQMIEQPGGSNNLLSARNAAEACDCAWDRYQFEGGAASSSAIRSLVRSCVSETMMTPDERT